MPPERPWARRQGRPALAASARPPGPPAAGVPARPPGWAAGTPAEPEEAVRHEPDPVPVALVPAPPARPSGPGPSVRPPVPPAGACRLAARGLTASPGEPVGEPGSVWAPARPVLGRERPRVRRPPSGWV